MHPSGESPIARERIAFEESLFLSGVILTQTTTQVCFLVGFRHTQKTIASRFLFNFKAHLYFRSVKS